MEVWEWEWVGEMGIVYQAQASLMSGFLFFLLPSPCLLSCPVLSPPLLSSSYLLGIFPHLSFSWATHSGAQGLLLVVFMGPYVVPEPECVLTVCSHVPYLLFSLSPTLTSWCSELEDGHSRQWPVGPLLWTGYYSESPSPLETPPALWPRRNRK